MIIGDRVVDVTVQEHDGERVLGGGTISRRMDHDGIAESPLPATAPIGYQAVSVAE